MTPLVASRWPAILGVQLCVVLFACGRSDVFDLGQGDSSVGDALLKDAALDTGVPADTGPMLVDAGEHDTGVPVDTGVIIRDAGEQFPDAEPPDLGFIPDAEIEDAPSPDADFEDADTGIAADTGVPTDGGAPECMSDNDCGFNQHCDPQALTCVECYE